MSIDEVSSYKSFQCLKIWDKTVVMKINIVELAYKGIMINA